MKPKGLRAIGWRPASDSRGKDAREKGGVSEPHRIATRHTGPFDLADTAMGAAARLWNQCGHSQPLRRDSAGGHGIALSCPAPAGKAEVDQGGMEGFREQAAGEVLPAYSRGKEAVEPGTHEVVAALGCDGWRAESRTDVIREQKRPENGVR